MKILAQNEKSYYERYKWSLQADFEKASYDESKYEAMYREEVELTGSIYNIPEDVRFLIIIGIGGRGGLKKLLKGIKPSISVLVYEPDRVYLEYLCCKEDFTELILNKQIDLIPGTDSIEDDIRCCVEDVVDLLVLKHMFVQYYPGYSLLYPEKMEQVKETVRELILKSAMEFRTVIPNQRTIIKNQLYALSILWKSSLASSLFDRFVDKNMPIILVGAGPSLEKNVSVLKKAEGKAMIVACTRSAEILEKNGVKIDLVIMIDYALGYDYCQHDEKRKYTVLFHSQSAADIQKEYMGHGIYFGFDKERYPLSWLKKEFGSLPTGGSVMTCVFSLLIEAGFREYILIGEDLAYSDDGRTHSGRIQEEVNEKTYFVDGINGEKIRSRADWKVFLEFFEKMIELHPSIHVIDASEGGALIQGTEVCTLEHAITCLDESKYLPVAELWKILPKVQDDGEVTLFFEEIQKKCGEAQVLLGNAIMWNELLYDQMEKETCGRDEIRKISETYDKLYLEIMEGEQLFFIREYCADVLYQYLEKAQYLNTPERTLERMQLEKKVFRDIRMGCSELRSYVQELRENRD